MTVGRVFSMPILNMIELVLVVIFVFVDLSLVVDKVTHRRTLATRLTSFLAITETKILIMLSKGLDKPSPSQTKVYLLHSLTG